MCLSFRVVSSAVIVTIVLATYIRWTVILITHSSKSFIFLVTPKICFFIDNWIFSVNLHWQLNLLREPSLTVGSSLWTFIDSWIFYLNLSLDCFKHVHVCIIFTIKKTCKIMSGTYICKQIIFFFSEAKDPTNYSLQLIRTLIFECWNINV